MASDLEARPPIPASMAHRPVRGGIALPWVNAELADGGVDFRSPHTAKYEQAWRQCRCQSCGNPAGPRVVLVCGPRQVLELRFDEPPTCPPCAVYARAACPFVSGRATTYSGRRHLTEGHRGEKCADPGCECGGWLVTDPVHSERQSGPNLPWYACWIRPGDYALTAHTIVTRCSDLGCEHERTLVNGAMLTRLPMKVQLLSVPGEAVERRTLSFAEALEHPSAAIDTAGVKPAGRSALWDYPPGTVLDVARSAAPAGLPAKPAKARARRLPRDARDLERSIAELTALRDRVASAAAGEAVKIEIPGKEAGTP